jgi:hypothetical protein
MVELELFEKVDDDGPFSRRELLIGLGVALAWVGLSAALVLLLPAGLL